jgi:hypothetical protein
MCDKTFTRKDSLERHKTSSCTVHKNKNKKLEELYQELIKKMDVQIEQINNQNNEIRELKEENSKISKPEDDIKKVTITNIQNINNTQNNFNVLPFGDEDYSFLTNSDLKKIFNKGFGSISELIKCVHFNQDKPENCNIYISNIKDPYVMVYNGIKWDLQPKDGAITELLENNGDYLEDQFYKLINKLDKRTKNRFERFLNQKDKDETINKLKKDIKLLLYNYKDIPLQAKQTKQPISDWKMIKINKS